MADIVIRPSSKFIKAGFCLVFLIIIAAEVIYIRFLRDQERGVWLPAVTALLLLWPIERLIRRRAVKLTLSGDKLRYESGFLSTSTRIIQLPKVQDVRVNQSLGQRIVGVGDLSIETAGESSRLVVQNLDSPHALAEQIIEASSHGTSSGLTT